MSSRAAGTFTTGAARSGARRVGIRVLVAVAAILVVMAAVTSYALRHGSSQTSPPGQQNVAPLVQTAGAADPGRRLMEINGGSVQPRHLPAAAAPAPAGRSELGGAW